MTYSKNYSPCFVILMALFFMIPSVAFSADSPYLDLKEIVSLKSVGHAEMSPNGDAIAYVLSVPRALYRTRTVPPTGSCTWLTWKVTPGRIFPAR